MHRSTRLNGCFTKPISFNNILTKQTFIQTHNVNIKKDREAEEIQKKSSISPSPIKITSPIKNAVFDPSQPGTAPLWYRGRRIIELGHLAEQLVCVDCTHPLLLKNIVNENRHGYGSTLMIECECGSVREVTTSTTHRTGSRGPAVFDVNTKAALAMIHSGTGHTQIRNFMSTLGIEGLHSKTLKKRETEVGPHVLSVARQTCHDALLEEIAMQKENTQPGDIPSEEQLIQGEFAYDMGWQKRGSGRAYDSKSGIGTLIGNNTKKICSYAVRSKDCRKCTYHLNKGSEVPDHTCSKNWDGSSKAMEPDVAVEVIKDVEQQNIIQVGTLIMDDDTTTMAKIKQEISHPVTKWSDLNHTRKHLGNSLYNLQNKHKCLSVKAIQFFQKCFSYAVSQNKGNPENLTIALRNIVPHAFGEHDGCGESWCGFNLNPDSYKHKSLPYGRNLSGEELRVDLNTIFEMLVKNVNKIAPGGSTKDVESFNNMVASKAPKRCHYSASESLSNRVSCAVAQKNIGPTYICKINEAIGLSPGNVSLKIGQHLDNLRKRRSVIETTRAFKMRKLEKKLKKHAHTKKKESTEGITYQTSVGLTNVADVLDIPTSKPMPIPNKVPNIEECNKVYCDIETTSLSKKCDLVQISAISGSDSFNKYILPAQPISQAASNVTGLTVYGNVLFYNGKPVNTSSLKTSLTLFLAWLEDHKPLVLVGHNFKVFDQPRILRAFKSCHLLNAFQNSICGMVDTLPLFRELHPNLEKHTQEHLVDHVLNKTYTAHNALADVKSLQELVMASDINTETVKNHSLSITSAVDIFNHDMASDINIDSMQVLQQQAIVSKAITTKIARSGLNLSHLKLAVDRAGLDGLTQLLSEKINGKPRVTSTKRILEKLFDFLKCC